MFDEKILNQECRDRGIRLYRNPNYRGRPNWAWWTMTPWGAKRGDHFTTREAAMRAGIAYLDRIVGRLSA